MSRKNRQLLIALLAAAALNCAACSTTTVRSKAPEAATEYDGVAAGEVLLVHYLNTNNPAGGILEETVYIADIDENGISGVLQNGDLVYIRFDDILRTEVPSDKPAVKRPNRGLGTAGKIARGAGIVVFCLIGALGGQSC